MSFIKDQVYRFKDKRSEKYSGWPDKILRCTYVPYYKEPNGQFLFVNIENGLHSTLSVEYAHQKFNVSVLPAAEFPEYYL